MANLKSSLIRRLAKAERVAVLAAGSELRGDDAAGLLAAAELERLLKTSPTRISVSVLIGDTAPENLSGEIKRLKPTHLIILDAADVGKDPGHLQLVDPDALTHNPTISTHTLPFGVLANYLRAFFPVEIIILGIQPGSREFGRPVSKAVSEAAKEAAAVIVEALQANE